MGAGLKGDIEGRAARRFAGLGQGERFGMGAAGWRRSRFTKDFRTLRGVADDNGAHGRVRPGAPQTGLAHRQGAGHEPLVFLRGGDEVRLRSTEPLLSHSTPRGGSPWWPSSPRRLSKSLASLKFR